MRRHSSPPADAHVFISRPRDRMHEIVSENRDGIPLVSIGGELEGMPAAEALHAALLAAQGSDEAVPETEVDGLPGRSPHIVVDLTDCTRIDASCLGALVAAQKRARDRGGRLHLANPTPAARRAFEITRLDRVLPIAATLQQALANARAER